MQAKIDNHKTIKERTKPHSSGNLDGISVKEIKKKKVRARERDDIQEMGNRSK